MSVTDAIQCNLYPLYFPSRVPLPHLASLSYFQLLNAVPSIAKTLISRSINSLSNIFFFCWNLNLEIITSPFLLVRKLYYKGDVIFLSIFS